MASPPPSLRPPSKPRRIDGIVIARFEVARRLHIGRPRRRTEESYFFIFGKRKCIIVVLHKNKAFPALLDGEFFGSSHHLLSSVVIAGEVTFLAVVNNITFSTKEIIERRPPIVRKALTKTAYYKKRKEGCRQAAPERFEF